MSGLIGRLALVAAILAAILVASAAPAYRHAGFDLPHAFELMRWGTYAAGGAGALAVIWLVLALVGRSAMGVVSVVMALVIAAGAAYFPISMMMKADGLPFIHDVTTDTANPPVFVAIAPIRADAPNGVDYTTDPALQQKGYADIQPMTSDLTPAALFEKALKVANDMGWEIAAVSPEQGRIEATDTTAWWGFKDDIVIRVVAAGAGSRLDIRSMSRVGKSDVGKNAQRIRAFMEKLKAANQD
jgi:uncharacterized protein (DUF1499 family)